MMMISNSSLKVKVCGMRDEANIEDLLRHSPQLDYLGFIFHPPSPRFVGELLRPDFMRSLAARVATVGVFVDTPPEKIIAARERFQFHAVQLHGAETPDDCEHLRERFRANSQQVQVWKALSIASAEDIARVNAYDGAVNLVLLDTKGAAHGGNGTRFDWTLLQGYTAQTDFFLSGGIDMSHLAEIRGLHHPQLRGVDVNSRFEIAPALKDARRVHDFLDQISATP
jgi:phosphoribosylanthranilate isomerase